MKLGFTYSEYRLCLVNGKKALFHRWEDRAQTVPVSLLRGGHSAGQVWAVLGIVECEDGTVLEAYPCEITFIDDEFKKYAFPEFSDKEVKKNNRR